MIKSLYYSRTDITCIRLMYFTIILKGFTNGFRKFLAKVTMISFGLVFVQRMSGAGGVIQYSSTLFKISGSTIEPNTACIIVGTFQLVASGVSFMFVDKVGRRTLLLISSAVITMCLVLLILYFSLIENGECDIIVIGSFRNVYYTDQSPSLI